MRLIEIEAGQEYGAWPDRSYEHQPPFPVRVEEVGVERMTQGASLVKPRKTMDGVRVTWLGGPREGRREVLWFRLIAGPWERFAEARAAYEAEQERKRQVGARLAAAIGERIQTDVTGRYALTADQAEMLLGRLEEAERR